MAMKCAQIIERYEIKEREREKEFGFLCIHTYHITMRAKVKLFDSEQFGSNQ